MPNLSIRRVSARRNHFGKYFGEVIPEKGYLPVFEKCRPRKTEDECVQDG